MEGISGVWEDRDFRSNQAGRAGVRLVAEHLCLRLHRAGTTVCPLDEESLLKIASDIMHLIHPQLVPQSDIWKAEKIKWQSCITEVVLPESARSQLPCTQSDIDTTYNNPECGRQPMPKCGR